ncbi:MAG: CFI-box-CTERM domain-containing protein [Methyloceanibacter sp.]|uniref:CFI-box-CTERM domain-containing protein n=1 Tax=Methyloceanibacter sp. TaxID=1965321 RepID=UPI003D9B1D0E
MILNSRRRVLALLLAAGAGARLPALPSAFAAEEQPDPEQPEKPDCFASQAFGKWKAQATNKETGARFSEVAFSSTNACSLSADLEVSGKYDARLTIYGDPETNPLPKEFLIKPEHRLLVASDDGKIVVDVALCGNCTDIYEGNVSIVLPLATAPLLRDGKSAEFTIKLGDEQCSFKVDTDPLHKALSWAEEKRTELAKDRDNDKCAALDDCFITSACCEVLGLSDDCFELRSLRAYRDQVLASTPGGAADIALYYRIAPEILRAMPSATRHARLGAVYLLYILPAAVAARLGLPTLAHRIYRAMMQRLAREFAPLLMPALGGNR